MIDEAGRLYFLNILAKMKVLAQDTDKLQLFVSLIFSILSIDFLNGKSTKPGVLKVLGSISGSWSMFLFH